MIWSSATYKICKRQVADRAPPLWNSMANSIGIGTGSIDYANKKTRYLLLYQNHNITLLASSRAKSVGSGACGWVSLRLRVSTPLRWRTIISRCGARRSLIQTSVKQQTHFPYYELTAVPKEGPGAGTPENFLLRDQRPHRQTRNAREAQAPPFGDTRRVPFLVRYGEECTHQL